MENLTLQKNKAYRIIQKIHDLKIKLCYAVRLGSKSTQLQTSLLLRNSK